MASHFLHLVLLILLANAQEQVQLNSSVYNLSCPRLQTIIKSAVGRAMKQDTRIAASLLRLFFHDCFVNGCDASVLLDDTNDFKGEKTSLANDKSLRGFDVVENIKAQVEKECSAIVSCADILAIAARDSVVLSGGPNWEVELGRRDSVYASLNLSNINIPSPRATYAQLVASFQNVGLTIQDMVALSGAHTIGSARCARFKVRLYNFNDTARSDPRINPSYLCMLYKICPQQGEEETISPLDHVTPNVFDNQYFRNILHGEALLNSDAELGVIKSIVYNFSINQDAFFTEFVRSMINMGRLRSLSETNGEIRHNCRRVNMDIT